MTSEATGPHDPELKAAGQLTSVAIAFNSS